VTDAGVAIKRTAGARSLPIDQLRIELTFTANTSRTLTHVAVLGG